MMTAAEVTNALIEADKRFNKTKFTPLPKDTHGKSYCYDAKTNPLAAPVACTASISIGRVQVK